MKFQRINDKVIRCVITKEEMNNAGVDLDDLMANREKAEKFLQYVLDQAKFEVNYETNGDILNVQLSVMRDGEISMMISDDHNAAVKALAQQFQSKLFEFRELLENAKRKMANPKEKIIASIIDSTKEDSVIEFDFWAKLNTLDLCIELAKSLGELKEGKSYLYRYNDSYYMNIVMSVTKAEIVHNVFMLSEYAQSLNDYASSANLIKEHGELIISENALNMLAEI